ncbi:MAG: TonB-dependent siderophore receptor [Roseiarcus sp.]
MSRFRAPVGVSAAAITIVLASWPTQAQESLPTIDIGAPKPTTGLGEGAGPGFGFGPGSGNPVLTPQNSYVTPVISTGTKTDTPVMDTPVNVQEITEKVLDDQQAINLAEAVRNVSGVYAASGAVVNAYTPSPSIFLRGFQTNNIYVDGFRIDGGGASSYIDVTGTRELGNVQSVEVLKGPAAILYGLSEPGGIINVTTKDPQDTPHYAVTQQVGSLALYRTVVNATGPLTQDKSVLYRLDTSYENNGAPFGSLIDGTHLQSFFVAPVVKWNLSEQTWVKAEAQYNDYRTSLLRSNAVTFNGSFVNISRNINYYGDSALHEPSTLAAFTISHKFNEDWSIKQRVAYAGFDFSADLNNPSAVTVSNGLPILTRSNSQTVGLQRTFSTNLDLVGHFDLLGVKNTLLFGGDFYRTSTSSETFTGAPFSSTLVSLNFPVEPGLPTGASLTETATSLSRQDTSGLYIQDQIELPYGFFAMAGARYQKITQQSTSRINATSASLNSNINASLDADRVTPRYGLLWRPEKWISLYGAYTEGFGAQSGYVYPGNLAPPSDARSWELGAKFEAYDGRLRATVDYFDLKKTNTLVSDTDPTHLCNGTASCTVPTGASESKGMELDVKGELLPGWNVILAYTNEDVRVIQGTVSGYSTEKAGSRLPYTPRNIGRLATTYEFQDTTFKGLKVGATYTYTGSQAIQTAGGLNGIVPPLLPAYGIVDLMSAYTFTVDGLKTTAQLNATNIFDKTYYTDADQNNSPTKGFGVSYRRTYGPPFALRGSLRVEF